MHRNLNAAHRRLYWHLDVSKQSTYETLKGGVAGSEFFLVAVSRNSVSFKVSQDTVLKWTATGRSDVLTAPTASPRINRLRPSDVPGCRSGP